MKSVIIIREYNQHSPMVVFCCNQVLNATSESGVAAGMSNLHKVLRSKGDDASLEVILRCKELDNGGVNIGYSAACLQVALKELITGRPHCHQTGLPL